MVPLWFTLSALCFVGAAVLLYVDLDRRRGSRTPPQVVGQVARVRLRARVRRYPQALEARRDVDRRRRHRQERGPRPDPRRGGLHLRPRRRRDGDRAAPQGRHQRRRRPAAQGHQGAAGERHLAARSDRPADGVLHQPRRRPSRLRPADGDVRAHRARLRRDHVERTELDAGQHAGHQHARPVGRGPAHRAPVQRPAAGAAAAAHRCRRPARRAPQRFAQPSAHPCARRAFGAAGGCPTNRPAAPTWAVMPLAPRQAGRGGTPTRCAGHRRRHPTQRNGRQSANYPR